MTPFFYAFALLNQVEDSVRIAEALLSDLSGFKGFLRFNDDLLETLRAYEQEQFEDWSRDILSGLADPKSGIRLENLQHLTPVLCFFHEAFRIFMGSFEICIFFSAIVLLALKESSCSEKTKTNLTLVTY